MAVQRRKREFAKKCRECGKPLYRPKTCRECGEVFCRDHVSSRKHGCIDGEKAEKAGIRRPGKRAVLAATIAALVIGSAFIAYRILGEKREMIETGERGMKIGTYLQYFRDDLKQSTGLGGVDIRDLLEVDGEAWAATGDGVHRLKGNTWKRESLDMSGGCNCLADNGGSLYAACDDGVYRNTGDGWTAVGDKPPGSRAMAVLVDEAGDVWVGTDVGVARLSGGGWLPADIYGELEIRSLANSRGALFAGTNAGLWTNSGGKWINLTSTSGAMFLPSVDIRGIEVAENGDMWICTSGGVSIFDGRDYFYTFTGKNGLPYEDSRCVSFGLNGTVWVGTHMGVCELRDGRWHYYNGPRWMSNSAVASILPDREGSVWFGTRDGLSKIHGEWITLEEKSRLINKIVQQRHERDGYIEFISLKSPGDFSQNWTYHASDNDGLWTSIYLAAESFRYAATGDPSARANAKKSYEAMKRLEELTGIRGFPARAAVRKGSTGVVKSGGEWHDSTVDSGWEWKGDTSSDEIDGHYFAYSIYHDLVADESEKRDVAALVSRIIDHILDNDYYLIDLDGKRTRWGVWNPREINDDPRWVEEHGLNSLEILSHLKVAIHMTGEERYERAYRELIEEHHYHINTIDQKIMPPGHVNHSDDELAFLAYYPLLLYEQDPRLRAIYLKSIERSWQIERIERSPFFNFVYGSATTGDFDLEESIEELRGMSPDLLDWPVYNSHRSDVQHRVQSGEEFSLPFEDRNMRRWNANGNNLDWGGGGTSEGDGAYFLMPYWMGRYHGFIIEGG